MFFGFDKLVGRKGAFAMKKLVSFIVVLMVFVALFFLFRNFTTLKDAFLRILSFG